jgi:SAM-dependent MidA family methyltransferase
MTTDVNFSACRMVAEKAGARVAALRSQGEFLMKMGIVHRVEQLLESPSVSDKQATDMVAALKRLVDPKEMGARFKTLQITSPSCFVAGYDDE